MSDNDKLSSLAVNHDGFAFDPSSGDSFVLNQSALMIVQSLQDGIGDVQIASDLTDQFDVDLDTATRDVTDFISRMRAMQLL